MKTLQGSYNFAHVMVKELETSAEEQIVGKKAVMKQVICVDVERLEMLS
jgi:hypothetical protein